MERVVALRKKSIVELNMKLWDFEKNQQLCNVCPNLGATINLLESSQEKNLNFNWSEQWSVSVGVLDYVAWGAENMCNAVPLRIQCTYTIHFLVSTVWPDVAWFARTAFSQTHTRTHVTSSTWQGCLAAWRQRGGEGEGEGERGGGGEREGGCGSHGCGGRPGYSEERGLHDLWKNRERDVALAPPSPHPSTPHPSRLPVQRPIDLSTHELTIGGPVVLLPRV